MKTGAMRIFVHLWRSPKVTDDGDGFFEPLSPPVMWAAVEPQGPFAGSLGEGRNLTHLVRMRYHPGVTMDTRLTYGGTKPDGTPQRELFVRGVQVLNDDNVEMTLLCEEIVPV